VAGFDPVLKQIPRSSRRNPLPVTRIHGSLLVGQEHSAGARVELLESTTPSPGADGVLHHPPEAFEGVEVRSAVGRQALHATLIMSMVAGRVELRRPGDPTAIDDPHHLLVGFPKGRHDWVPILTSRLGSKVGHDLREAFRGALVDGADDTPHHTPREATPRARRPPRLAVQGLLTFALTLPQGAGGEARAWGCAPPAHAGQGKAPEHRCVFIEPHDLTPACSIL